MNRLYFCDDQYVLREQFAEAVSNSHSDRRVR